MENSRRKFITDAAKTAVVLSVGAVTGSSLLQACSPMKKAGGQPGSKFKTSFQQQPLPYTYGALEPYIDAQTMEIHYTKHASGYAKNLAEAASAEGVSSSKPLEEVLWKISKYSTKMRNNAGGHYNHELFWKMMRARGEARPSGTLLTAIEAKFGSFAQFKTSFGNAAKNRFGSGWAWLILDKDNQLQITSTPNQDNPLMDIAEVRGTPLLCLDVWEHAYYLKYQNKRPDYIDNWWNLVNWDFVQQRYDTAIS